MGKAERLASGLDTLIMLAILPAILLHEASHYAMAWVFGAGDRGMAIVHEGWNLYAFGVHYDDSRLTGRQEILITVAPLAWFIPGSLLLLFASEGYLTDIGWWLMLAGATGLTDVIGLIDPSIYDSLKNEDVRMKWFIGDGPETYTEAKVAADD